MYFSITSIAAISALLLRVSAQAVGTNCDIIGNVTVAAGNTLGEIASDNNVTVAQILYVNPVITNPNSISIGQVIDIPNALCVVTAPAPAPALPTATCVNNCTFTYTVVAGDTFTIIAYVIAPSTSPTVKDWYLAINSSEFIQRKTFDTSVLWSIKTCKANLMIVTISSTLLLLPWLPQTHKSPTSTSSSSLKFWTCQFAKESRRARPPRSKPKRRPTRRSLLHPPAATEHKFSHVAFRERAVVT